MTPQYINILVVFRLTVANIWGNYQRKGSQYIFIVKYMSHYYVKKTTTAIAAASATLKDEKRGES